MEQGMHWYRVEHHDGDLVTALGRVADAFHHASALAPFRSRLVHDGVHRGRLVLIEEATGQVVARLTVCRPKGGRPNRRS